MLTGEKEVLRQEGNWVSGSDPPSMLIFLRSGQVFYLFGSFVIVIILSVVQFCPSDPTKVMVTSADSQVRILSGVNIMSKYKGEW